MPLLHAPVGYGVQQVGLAQAYPGVDEQGVVVLSKG